MPSLPSASSAMGSARSGTGRPRDQRGREPFPVQPAPGALHQHRAAGGGLPRAVPGRQRAPGLGCRLGIHAAEGDAWFHAGRAAAASSMWILSCRAGCPISPCWTCGFTGTSSTSGSGAKARKRSSRCCAEIQRWSSAAGLEVQFDRLRKEPEPAALLTGWAERGLNSG